jgi:hypothetical protein
VRWDEIVPLSEGKDADVADTVSTWREVLSVAGEYIGSEVAKRARQVDELGVIREGGTVSLSEPLQANIKGLASSDSSGSRSRRARRAAVFRSPVTAFVIEMLARAVRSTMIQNGHRLHRPGRDDLPRRQRRAEGPSTSRRSRAATSAARSR